MVQFDATTSLETHGTPDSMSAALDAAIATLNGATPYIAVIRWDNEIGELYSAGDMPADLEAADWTAVGFDGMQLALEFASKL